MRTIHALFFAGCFAAALPGQEASHPQLLAAIAQEEVEGNLAAAETTYRKLAADTALPHAVRGQAALRLANLLARVGRTEDAAQARELARSLGVQPAEPGDTADPQRTQQLQNRARALVAGQADFPPAILEQLRWIGAPAAPAIIAWIEDYGQVRPVPGVLTQLLWEFGDDESIDFLARVMSEPESSNAALPAAHQSVSLRDEQGLRAVEAALRTGPIEVVSILTQRLGARIPADLLLRTAETRDPAFTALILRAFPDLPAGADLELARRYARLVRNALASTEPSVGAAALDCNASVLRRSALGIEVVLDHLTAFSPKQLARVMGDLPEDWEASPAEPRHDRIVAAALSIPPQAGPAREWIQWLVMQMDTSLPLEPHALTLVDAGYPLLPPLLERWDLTPADLRTLVQRAVASDDAVPAKSRNRFFVRLSRAMGRLEREPGITDLAADLFALAKAWDCAEEVGSLVHLTRNPDAAAWVLENISSDRSAEILARLNQRVDSPAVRDAMLRRLAPAGRTEPSTPTRLRLIFGLLERGDPRGLEHVEDGDPTLHWSFIDSDQTTSIAKIVTSAGKKGHEALDPEVVAPFVPLLLAHSSGWSWSSAHFSTPLPTIARALADAEARDPERRRLGWLHGFLRGPAAVQPFAEELLADPDPAVRFCALQAAADAEATWLDKALAPTLDRLVDDADESCADYAARLLERSGAVSGLAWVTRLAASPHAKLRKQAIYAVGTCTDDAEKTSANLTVRTLLDDPDGVVRSHAARYSGERVLVEAVPTLLRRMQDPEAEVRKAAEEALERIRFAREQQQLWDQLRDGIDTSPRGALERLLRQATPDQPKERRLAAIKALGSLAMPEALPYLIDWMGEDDAEIRGGCEAAMAAIHLNPRR
ncbi:MAG: HEAT repeat domain-containing protein [Planctomycetota bacterium]